jgi:hypothetical protein
MTQEEFSKTGFGAGDMAKYQHGIFPIAQIDFEEQLFGLIMNIPGSEPGDISWVRCENVEFIPCGALAEKI